MALNIVFWGALGVIFYAYLGYPILVAALSLVFQRPINKKAIEPTVSLLITAYNEEQDIGAKLENSLTLDYPRNRFEIVVASDGSTDATETITREFARLHPEITIRVHRVEGRVGKTATQNSAVLECRGEIVVFSDAAAMYEVGALRALVANYADPTVGAVSGMYTYCNRAVGSLGIATPVFWSVENFVKAQQTKIYTITGCCGCIYSLRRQLYVPLPDYIISDLVEPLMIFKKGYRVIFETGARAVELTAGKSSEEFRMRVRVIVRGIKGMLFVRQLYNPLKYPYIAWQLFSHKVIRWLVPFFCIILMMSNVFLIFRGWYYKYFIAIQFAFYIFASVGLILEKYGVTAKIFYLPLYFCVVNIASLISIVKVLRGEQIVIWQTQREEKI